jgi:ZIP family zinc transporter
MPMMLGPVLTNAATARKNKIPLKCVIRCRENSGCFSAQPTPESYVSNCCKCSALFSNSSVRFDARWSDRSFSQAFFENEKLGATLGRRTGLCRSFGGNLTWHDARAPAYCCNSLGVALMLLVKRLTEGDVDDASPDEKKPQNRTGFLVTMCVDVLIDGLLIGVGFAAGAKAGMILTVALAFEVMFLGLAIAVALGASGSKRGRVLRICAVMAGLLLFGAAMGATFLHSLSGALLEGVLAFGCAALLYLVIEELMVEAHEERETPIQTAMFFVGFISLLLVEMVA